jgi:hypothetical protein
MRDSHGCFHSSSYTCLAGTMSSQIPCRLRVPWRAYYLVGNDLQDRGILCITLDNRLKEQK